MRVHFGCTETAPGIWTVYFDDPIFKTPSCWEELKQMSLQYKKVLLLGVFDWSNYSHTVVADIIDHKEDFNKYNIGLAAFCPSSFSQIRLICPDVLSCKSHWGAEPLMIVLEQGLFKKARAGPINWRLILDWVLNLDEDSSKQKEDKTETKGSGGNQDTQD